MCSLQDSFFLQNPLVLLNTQLAPLHNMPTVEKLNCVGRLVFCIFTILIVFNFSYSIHFLVISLLVIIIVYYRERRDMPKEKYTKTEIPSVRITYDMSNLAKTSIKNIDGRKIITAEVKTPLSEPFCTNDVLYDIPNNSGSNLNQNLAGPANSKTLAKPLVIPPTHDLGYWRENDSIIYSRINDISQEDMYLSGYAVSTCCSYLQDGTELVPVKEEEENEEDQVKYGVPLEKYSNNCGNPNIIAPNLVQDKVYIPTLPVQEKYSNNCGKQNIVAPNLVQDKVYIPTLPYVPVRERYIDGESQNTHSQNTHSQNTHSQNTHLQNIPSIRVLSDQPGMINTECGYNPEQVYHAGLPSNLAVGNCTKDPRMKQYNKNLFTQTVTPGVYTTNQVNEPISSNIGISFQQQFEPVTCYRDDKGLHYTEHDPRLIDSIPKKKETKETEKATYDNVYDPRFYGYGTSYRSYYEPVTGQTRFFYDDVNSIRMPNYIVRSKVDHLPYADQYGPVKEGDEQGNKFNSNIRALAQDSYLRDSLQFRDDITERAMRKMNAEAWQRRQSPFGARQINSSKSNGRR
jgi:hypothetical protein